MKKERKSMKYVKPEVEIVLLDEKIFTGNITGESSDKDGGVHELGDGTPL